MTENKATKPSIKQILAHQDEQINTLVQNIQAQSKVIEALTQKLEMQGQAFMSLSSVVLNLGGDCQFLVAVESMAVRNWYDTESDPIVKAQIVKIMAMIGINPASGESVASGEPAAVVGNPNGEPAAVGNPNGEPAAVAVGK